MSRSLTAQSLLDGVRSQIESLIYYESLAGLNKTGILM